MHLIDPWVVVSSDLFVEDKCFDEHIFQRGWFNHQLDDKRKVLGDFVGLCRLDV